MVSVAWKRFIVYFRISSFRIMERKADKRNAAQINWNLSSGSLRMIQNQRHKSFRKMWQGQLRNLSVNYKWEDEEFYLKRYANLR
ncbi:MAG: hypothetical protein EA411_13445 [Saprospirales bacterium]|nr:MAG: hypothetical protein EA411_13445 [Saprospirales bacterium]